MRNKHIMTAILCALFINQLFANRNSPMKPCPKTDISGIVTQISFHPDSVYSTQTNLMTDEIIATIKRSAYCSITLKNVTVSRSE